MKPYITLLILSLYITGCNTVSDKKAILLKQLRPISEQIMLYQSGELNGKELFLRTFIDLPTKDQDKFHLELLDMNQSADTGCNIDKMAIRDIKSGSYNILQAGDTFIPLEEEQQVWQYLEKKYQISYFSFRHGGREPRIYYELIDSYNEIVESKIEKKFNKTIGDMWTEAIESLRLEQVD